MSVTAWESYPRPRLESRACYFGVQGLGCRGLRIGGESKAMDLLVYPGV